MGNAPVIQAVWEAANMTGIHERTEYLLSFRGTKKAWLVLFIINVMLLMVLTEIVDSS